MTTDLLDQALWLARRQAAPRRRERDFWTAERTRQLESMVGKRTIPEMAAALGCRPVKVSVRLTSLGYSIPKDVYLPLGLNVCQAARRLGMDQFRLKTLGHAGKFKLSRCNGKDFLIRWPEFRKLEREMRAHRTRRQRALDRIKEPTISAHEFGDLIGLSPTQASRYLKGKIVRAWKIPMPWMMDASHDRWDWRVSKADAERVTRLRAEGKLRLARKEFRKISAYENGKVTKLRHARRLGKRDDLSHRLSCVVPGCYSVRQVASHVGLSESEVYYHIQLGRLSAEHKRVGNRTYVAVRPEALDPYARWCKRENKYTGPIHGRKRESDAVLAAGYLTVKAALERYPDLTAGALNTAIERGRIPSKRIGRMIALKQKDVRAYVKLRRRWPHPHPAQRTAGLGKERQ